MLNLTEPLSLWVSGIARSRTSLLIWYLAYDSYVWEKKNFLTTSHWIVRVYLGSNNTAHFQSTKLGQLFIAVQSIVTHSTSNVWNILSFQILDNTCYQVFTFSYQVDVKWYLIAILISISQISSEIECLFVHIWMAVLVSFSIHSFAYFSVGLLSLIEL